MIFQEKLRETAAEFRGRAAALADIAIANSRAHVLKVEQRLNAVAPSFAALAAAGVKFGRVARLHARQFTKTNSSLAVAAGEDVAALLRHTYATIAKREVAKPAARNSRVPRKRTRTKKA
jgi:hypothetical protein